MSFHVYKSIRINDTLELIDINNISSGLIVHNDTTGLQGGTTNEYYHLTSAEYTGTGTGVFVRKTNASLTTPTMDYAYFTQYPYTQPATDFYFNNIQVLTFGYDEFANIDGSPAGFSWSNFDSGDGQLQLRTIDGTYLGLRVGTFNATYLSGDGASITNLTAGALSGVVSIANGGTNKALTLAAGAVVWTDANSFELTAAGSSGQILRSGGTTTPTWSTATYPATAGTSGKILISDGTNIVSSTPTYPNSASTSGKVLQSDGTNLVMSTPTYPSSASTAGKIIRSDGTNLVMSTATYPNNVTANNILYATGTDTVGSSSTLTYNGTNLATSGGAIQLTNGTANKIEFGTTGVAAPGASSAGMKIKLYGTNGAMATTDYAIGIEASTMWLNTNSHFKFYQGTSTLALYYQGSATPNLQAWGFNNASPIARVDIVGANGTANTAGQAPLYALGGTGGTSSNASAGGTGGIVYVAAGPGGAGSSTGPGGNGGYYLFTAGTGGDNSSTGNGGAGGQFSFSAGAGGPKSAGASGSAGAGGAYYTYGGSGGDTFTTVSGNAGAGGSIYTYGGSGGGMYGRAGTAAQGGHVVINAGQGGIAVAGSSTAGAGGHVYVSGGVGGDIDGGSTYGAAGNVYLDGGTISGGTGYGHVYVGTQNPQSFLMVGNGGTPDVTCVVSDSDTTNLGLRVENLQSSATSDARVHIRSAGASGGDAYTLYGISTTTQVAVGLDNSDSDKFKIVYGTGVSAATGALEMTSTSIVWNEAGSDVDYRIESDTNVNMFVLDAGLNRIGIGTASPSYTLDVSGQLRATDYYSGDGTQGTTSTITFYDVSGGFHTVTIKDGLVTSWTVA